MVLRWETCAGCIMDGVENERYTSTSRHCSWLSQPESEASTLLWKLKDCFSTSETNSLRRSGNKNVSTACGCVVHIPLFLGFLKNWYLIILCGHTCGVNTSLVTKALVRLVRKYFKKKKAINKWTFIFISTFVPLHSNLNVPFSWPCKNQDA